MALLLYIPYVLGAIFAGHIAGFQGGLVCVLLYILYELVDIRLHVDGGLR